MDANALSDVQCMKRTAKACGPGALAAGAKLALLTTSALGSDAPECAGDGDTKAGLTGASTQELVNTIAQGMPMFRLHLR